MLQIDEDLNGRKIELQAGQRFEIRLLENRTAGFRWHVVESGEPACVLVEDSYESPQGPTGSPGVHHWQFQAASEAQGRIELAYYRSWERDAAPAQAFKLAVDVSQ